MTSGEYVCNFFYNQLDIDFKGSAHLSYVREYNDTNV